MGVPPQLASRNEHMTTQMITGFVKPLENSALCHRLSTTCTLLSFTIKNTSVSQLSKSSRSNPACIYYLAYLYTSNLYYLSYRITRPLYIALLIIICPSLYGVRIWIYIENW